MPKIHIHIHPIYGNYNNYTFSDTIDKKAGFANPPKTLKESSARNDLNPKSTHQQVYTGKEKL